jgi:hypothetical protein
MRCNIQRATVAAAPTAIVHLVFCCFVRCCWCAALQCSAAPTVAVRLRHCLFVCAKLSQRQPNRNWWQRSAAQRSAAQRSACSGALISAQRMQCTARILAVRQYALRVPLAIDSTEQFLSKLLLMLGEVDRRCASVPQQQSRAAAAEQCTIAVEYCRV